MARKLAKSPETTLRIVGGKLRGSKIAYAGDTRVRPMKDRVREAMFNLIGPPVKGTYVVDLFGGTGAVALEAISRGAVGATIIERHFPTAKTIRQNVAALSLEPVVNLVTSDTFYWARQADFSSKDFPNADSPGAATGNESLAPWLICCCPPYSFYSERTEETLGLIQKLIDAAPPNSMVVVEATPEFDYGQLPHPEHWDVRTYAPAVIGLLHLADVEQS